MKKIIAALVAATAIAGGAAIAGPGPNGSNNHGLCTAYFNGSQNGQAHKRKAGPFPVLEQTAGDQDGDEDIDAVDVWMWCLDTENNPKGIGGQPDDPNTPENDGNGNNGRGRG